MSRTAEFAYTQTPSDRLWTALGKLELYVHGVEGAHPHHPAEKIGLAYPHATGGTLTYELDFWRDVQAGVYLPRTNTQLMTAMTIHGEEVDMVLGEEHITLLDDEYARVGLRGAEPSEGAVLSMAARVESMLRIMQVQRPDATWWVDQGRVFWGGDET